MSVHAGECSSSSGMGVLSLTVFGCGSMGVLLLTVFGCGCMGVHPYPLLCSAMGALALAVFSHGSAPNRAWAVA